MLDPVRAKARAIGITAASFVGGVLLASGLAWTTDIEASSLLQSAPAPQDVQPLAELSESFISISESVTPAVVSIRTERMETPGMRGGIPEEFRDLFPFPSREPNGEPQMVRAGGTGFLIREDGYILTNNHVVADAMKITVVTMDRREYSAELIGRDPTTDVAVIKINGNDLPHVRIGDPNATRVGEWVVAIGNPLGLDFTVTAGIVSAKNRSIGIIGDNIDDDNLRQLAVESFIQTDAAINPGNSGGPLVNIRGEVVGMNTAIASENGLSQGYGFAVPIDLASLVAEDLIRYGRWRRAVLGVSIDPVLVEDSEAFNLPYIGGAVVQGFSPTSLAQRAGVAAGDVIVSLEGEEVRHVNELQRLVARHRPGDRVKLEVIRYGERRAFEVQLVEAAAPVTAAATAGAPAAPVVGNRLGARVVELTAELARTLEYPRAGGVVVQDVSRTGPLGSRFNAQGFKIVRADRVEVTSVEQFERIVRSKDPGTVVSLTFENAEGVSRIINIRLP